jgi:hypothetical protein
MKRRKSSPNDTASHAKKLEASATPLQEPNIWHPKIRFIPNARKRQTKLGLCSDNNEQLYSDATRFESQPSYWLSGLTFSRSSSGCPGKRSDAVIALAKGPRERHSVAYNSLTLILQFHNNI